MDWKLRKILDDILNNEDNTGCDGDLTVTSLSACDRLRKYLKTQDKLDKLREISINLT